LGYLEPGMVKPNPTRVDEAASGRDRQR
jgi:hypothetical protein